MTLKHDENIYQITTSSGSRHSTVAKNVTEVENKFRQHLEVENKFRQHFEYSKITDIKLISTAANFIG